MVEPSFDTEMFVLNNGTLACKLWIQTTEQLELAQASHYLC